jgi:hypothetical protein
MTLSQASIFDKKEKKTPNSRFSTCYGNFSSKNIFFNKQNTIFSFSISRQFLFCFFVNGKASLRLLLHVQIESLCWVFSHPQQG